MNLKHALDLTETVLGENSVRRISELILGIEDSQFEDIKDKANALHFKNFRKSFFEGIGLSDVVQDRWWEQVVKYQEKLVEIHNSVQELNTNVLSVDDETQEKN